MNEKSYKVWINKKEYDIRTYQVMEPFFGMETADGEILFFPWHAIENVRIGVEMVKHTKENMESQANVQRVSSGPRLVT